MPDIRDIVRARLEELGWSINRLATEDRLTCGRDAIFRWLNGRSEIAAVHVGEVLEVLGLDVCVAEDHE